MIVSCQFLLSLPEFQGSSFIFLVITIILSQNQNQNKTQIVNKQHLQASSHVCTLRCSNCSLTKYCTSAYSYIHHTSTLLSFVSVHTKIFKIVTPLLSPTKRRRCPYGRNRVCQLPVNCQPWTNKSFFSFCLAVELGLEALWSKQKLWFW